ncbi:hypothetical protein M9Y10_018012 [Tritrichomonas musculus]|uniref:Protein kinase domain-containing protein n=1 Tax=Tritrichomonas musculus TaxID=1915356 RepID=A0ABR2HW09_9EUKA
MEKELQTSQETTKNLQEQLKNKTKELETSRKTTKNLQKELKSKEEKLKTSQETQKNLQKELKSKEEKLKTDQETQKNLQKELADLKEQIKEKSCNQKTQENEIKELKILKPKDIQNLEEIEEIGFGGTAKVLKVAKKTFFALKQLKKDRLDQSSIRHFFAEYEIMNNLDHPNILKTYGIFLVDKKVTPSILLEYCPFNLDALIKNKSLTKVKIVCTIYQIIEAMKYIHFRKVVHRDLKPSNILISEDGVIKIGDFGISKLMTIKEQSSTGAKGTFKFMAPEILNEQEYTEKVDVYSFGVLVFMLLNDGNLPSIILRDICLGKKAEIPSFFTEFSRNLIESCWNFDPKKRPSFDEILIELKKNNFGLIELSESELNEVRELVQVHESLIPSYSS